MQAKQYRVLKAHSGYVPGALRLMHPSVAEILNKQGLVALNDDPIEDIKPKEVVKRKRRTKAQIEADKNKD